jgi:hypothetical protein
MQRHFVFPLVLALALSTALTAQTRERVSGRTAEPVTLTASADVVAAYDALTALEPGQRKALFSALSTEVRAGLLRLQHQMYIVDHPELNSEQREVLNGIIARLTPEMYAPPSLAQTQIDGHAELDRLHQRAADLFGDDCGRIFYQLGGEPNVRHNWRLGVDALCNCAGSLECGEFTCIPRGCTIVPNSCGPDFSQACAGRCNG